jgi:hypothetical protein
MRYVDDVAAGHHDHDELMATLEEIERVLLLHGFSFKKVYSNQLWHKELNADGSSKDGIFAASDSEEEIFHHIWNYRQDTLLNPLRLNVNKKNRGIYTGSYLQDTDVENLVLTKTVLARLSGQVYSLSGAFFGSVIACFRVLFSHSCALTSSWTDTILDPEFNA